MAFYRNGWLRRYSRTPSHAPTIALFHYDKSADNQSSFGVTSRAIGDTFPFYQNATQAHTLAIREWSRVFSRVRRNNRLPLVAIPFPRDAYLGASIIIAHTSSSTYLYSRRRISRAYRPVSFHDRGTLKFNGLSVFADEASHLRSTSRKSSPICFRYLLIFRGVILEIINGVRKGSIRCYSTNDLINMT